MVRRSFDRVRRSSDRVRRRSERVRRSLDMVWRSSEGGGLTLIVCRTAQTGCGVGQRGYGVVQTGCGVAKAVVPRPAVRRPRVRFPSPAPLKDPLLSVSGEKPGWAPTIEIPLL
jgi:hypothetical protein